MSWQVSDKELSAVLAREPEVRFAYMIKRVVDRNLLWGWEQRDGSWLLLGDDLDSSELIPVWPHEAYAARVGAALGLEGVPAAVDLEEWLSQWLPSAQAEGRLIAVFPDGDGNAVVLSPDEFAEALKEELSAIE